MIRPILSSSALALCALPAFLQTPATPPPQEGSEPPAVEPAPSPQEEAPLDALVDPTEHDAVIGRALREEQAFVGPTGVALPPPPPPFELRGIIPSTTGSYVALESARQDLRVATGDRFAAADDPSAVLEVVALHTDGVVLAELASGARVAGGFDALRELVPQIGAAAASAPGPDRLARVDLRGLQLAEAARLLSDASGLKIVPSQGTADLPVSLYLRDVTPLEVVATLCDTHQLWYREEEGTGILLIRSAEEYERRLTTLQEEHTEYFTLLYPNVFDVGQAIRNLFGERVVFRVSEQDSTLFRELSDRLQRFDLLDARTQGFMNTSGANVGGNVFSQNGQYGGGFGQGATYGNSLYGNSYGGQQSVIDADTTPPEIEGELSAEEIMRLERLLTTGSLGGDAQDQVSDVLGGVYRAPIHVTVSRRQNKLLVRTSDELALDEIRTLVHQLDVPTALVLLEVRILAVALDDSSNTFFEYQWADGDFAGQFSTGAIAGPEPPALGPGGEGLRPNDFVFQFVDSTFAARLQALEQENRVHAVATPLVLTANNEVSRLFVGREVPLNRSFTGGQVVANQTTTSTVTGSTGIEFRPVGITLLVTPSINADRTVTLKVVQEASNADSTATILVPEGEGFTQQTVNVVSSQSVSGTIVAKSELAVAFGGLIETTTRKQESRVPILGDIPLLGVLFRQTTDEDERRELVVVVRPYVLATPAEFESTSRRLIESLGVDTDPMGLWPRGEVQGGTSPLQFELFGMGR